MRPKHICLLYTSYDEREAYVSSFIQKGLRSNEKAMYIQNGHQLAGFEPIIQKGDMKIVAYDELDSDGRGFDSQQMIEYISTETLRALSEKYTGLRVTTDMSAFHGREDLASVIWYEITLNRLLPNNCIGLCQYDRRSLTRTWLFDLIPLHPVIVSNEHTFHNFAYQTSSDLLSALTRENVSTHAPLNFS